MTLVSAQSPPPPDLMASGKRSAELGGALGVWVAGDAPQADDKGQGRGGLGCSCRSPQNPSCRPGLGTSELTRGFCGGFDHREQATFPTSY